MVDKLLVVTLAVLVSAGSSYGSITGATSKPLVETKSTTALVEKKGAVRMKNNEDGAITLGSYQLEKNDSYEVTIYWKEGGNVTLNCVSEKYNLKYKVVEGKPMVLKVPEDGTYNLTIDEGISMTDISCQVDVVDAPSAKFTPMETVKIKGETWYLVETEAQLRSIGQDDKTLSRRYLQNANITITSKWTPLSEDEPFTGHYDGNGFSIIGDLQVEGKYCGLFGTAEKANIHNVTIVGRGPIVVIAQDSVVEDNEILNVERSHKENK